eukprot:3973415-Pyramimonas_sp.AAC.1
MQYLHGTLAFPAAVVLKGRVGKRESEFLAREQSGLLVTGGTSGCAHRRVSKQPAARAVGSESCGYSDRFVHQYSLALPK